jgi:hypothetical protein
MRSSATFLLLALLHGCSTSNGLYCDESTPCESGPESFCDLDTSECTVPVAQTCNQADPCVDPDTPYCIVDQCVACENSSDCEGGELCSESNQCLPFSCDPAPEEDALCLELDASRGFCAEDGLSCRGCLEDSECSSGICDGETATCVPSSEVVYVAKSGSLDSECGTNSSPCLTVEVGMEKASATRPYLLVAAGSYDEQLSITNKTVTVVGVGATIEPVVTENSSVVDISGTANVTVRGVNLRANPLAGVFVTVVKCVGDTASVDLANLTVGGATNLGIDGRGCPVHANNIGVIGGGISVSDTVLALENSSVSVVEFGAGISANGVAVTIARSSVSDCNSGIRVTDGSLTLSESTVARNFRGGVSIENSDFTLINNFIVDNGAPGEISKGGLLINNVEAHSPQRIEFNTIAGNRITGELSEAANLSCSSLLPTTGHSNIVFKTFAEDSKPNISLSNCSLLYSNIENGTGGTGNIDLDPGFISPIAGPSGDYHLQESSPCKDAGDPDATLETDIDGDERPQAGRRDMGADEVVPQ